MNISRSFVLALVFASAVIALLLLAATQSPAQTVPTNIENAEAPDAPDPSKAVPPTRFLHEHPLTGRERVKWAVRGTVGPLSLGVVGVFSAAVGTAENAPKEYGGSWAGFGKRYGMRLTGVATSNAIEAGMGAFWGEDPRYFRDPTLPFGGRVRRVIKMTFFDYRADGQVIPAYARFIAIPGSNFLSNTWRADSEASTDDAVLRTVYGFASTMGKNAFLEFWPDTKRIVFHHKQ
ncbi:MAG TPA: hypothetical protein VLK33_16050 [Terriglobales bacterium]|nr:hypothetical protein [Terriglobales bacterium]